ncbi:ribosome silencing factor [bacterium]|nr:ribosome silencing factor [bacterium]
MKVLYVGDQTWISDYFIIVSGNSTTHTQTLAETILKNIKEKSISVEGFDEGKWILIDYAEIIIHIFYPETRTLYNLEKLWANI